jgi:hydroxymethylglutaryl-CoA reductase
MNEQNIIKGFSKLSKEEKIKKVVENLKNPEEALKDFKDYWHPDPSKQKVFDEFSENTISNYYFPFGIAPNFLINGKYFNVPMVIEESSVVAAASKGAKYWASRGGFHSKIVSTIKVGQVHFIWNGDYKKLFNAFDDLKIELKRSVASITSNMEKRGGGILDIKLAVKSDEIDNYYQLFAEFETVDSMGANFINSCLEEFAQVLKDFCAKRDDFVGEEKKPNVIMSILSNYTPRCLVKTWVECDLQDLGMFEDGDTPESFVKKFEKAVEIAQVDVHRATTHNKGVFNGIDAVVLATGNDFRAVEAAGHAYAAKTGKYKSLTDFSLENGRFKYELTVPLALGTVGGLTTLHPLVRRALEILENPNASELMMIASAAGLSNNFGAVTTLVTKGIQTGHMKMHLLNILNNFNATEAEKIEAVDYFKTTKVSFTEVRNLLERLRGEKV